MSERTATINGQPVPFVELSEETEQIDVSMATQTKPDPKWEYVDSAGHYHAWSDDGTTPTLTGSQEHRPCTGIHLHDIYDGDCEGYYVTVYRCHICHETVQPGTITSCGGREFVPGRRSWQVVTGTPDRLPAGGEVVSVRVDGNGEGGTCFGIGVVTEMEVSDHASWMRVAGLGALGERVSRSAA